jgi:hypothetical protein
MKATKEALAYMEDKLEECGIAIEMLLQLLSEMLQKLKDRGLLLLAGRDGDALVFVVRNVEKAQVLCSKCGK